MFINLLCSAFVICGGSFDLRTHLFKRRQGSPPCRLFSWQLLYFLRFNNR
nr:MAG TPA: hypothetical protein [Bacteriophage sp.]